MMVSIIVPVYNARRYLRQTAGDLLRQSYREIEVIFVDDGSTDGSGAMLDRLARKDERVCVIHQENGGTACARNAGMAAASGEYLMFMDDDDRIPSGYVREYVTAAEETGADIVMGGYRRVTPGGKTLRRRFLVRGHRPVMLYDASDTRQDRNPDFMKGEMEQASGDGPSIQESWLPYINISPWAKIYRRSFVEECGARFLEYPYGEDICFQMMLMARPVRIACIGSVSYGWVDHKESVSNTVHRGIRQEADIFPMLDKVLEVHPQRGDFFKYFVYRHCAYHIFVSGRDAGRKKLADEIMCCRRWLRSNGMVPVLSPFSRRLEGEILRDRIAVWVFRIIMKLYLDRLFAWLYCREE